MLTLTLALLIAVTSQQMAQARGVMKDAAGQIVICTGQGVQTVVLDHQGNPLDLVHICPDCALTLATGETTPELAEPQLIHMSRLAQTPVIQSASPLIHTRALARGPPLAV